MILTREAILPVIPERIELIPPVAVEVEPLRGRDRASGGRAQGIASKVVRVRVHVQHGVPQGPAVGLVVQEAPGKCVGVDAGRGVHGVRAFGGVDHGATADFLDGFVAVCFAAGVGAEEEGFGLAFVEAHETVFPVADVVPEAHV